MQQPSSLSINGPRLMERLQQLASIGSRSVGDYLANERLALTDEDKAGRDLVRGWMLELGLSVRVDSMGNVFGLRAGRLGGAPVTTGSHIDTVAGGGSLDGCLGVLAGLEVIACLNAAQLVTERPLCVAFFTNEEGIRFTPDMMGSGVSQGAFELGACLDARSREGARLGSELERIGYAGDAEADNFRAHCFVELHIEQGPLLEQMGINIGVVERVQGILWNEVRLRGVANHAGTTPMALRRDAGLVAAQIACAARALALSMGGDQVATVGCIELSPGVINVIPSAAKLSIDLRNTDGAQLHLAESRLLQTIADLACAESVELEVQRLVSLEPVQFDAGMTERIERCAKQLGHKSLRMPSGAGHDAQMFAPNCPTAMIFIPSRNGVSHNPAEYSSPEQILAGVEVLSSVLLECAGV